MTIHPLMAGLGERINLRMLTTGETTRGFFFEPRMNKRKKKDDIGLITMVRHVHSPENLRSACYCSRALVVGKWKQLLRGWPCTPNDTNLGMQR